MKLVIKSACGDSQFVDVFPTDTFIDLQKRTLEKTGRLLELEHFKCKNKEIKEDCNVVKYFQGGLFSDLKNSVDASSIKDGKRSQTNEEHKDSVAPVDTNTKQDDDSSGDTSGNEFLEHPGQLCRLCALPRNAMVYIFSEEGLRLGLRSKINTWLPTHVSRTDHLPKQVCISCIQKLNLCQEFSTVCMKAEQILNSLFEKRKFGYHIKSCKDVDISENKTNGSRETARLELTSKSNCSLEDNIKQKVENRDSVLHAVKKSVSFSDSRTTGKCDLKMESMLSETESDLVSDDSSESELVNMMLGDDCQERFRTVVPTEYCCPLCCEGRMVTLKQKLKEILNSSNSSFNLELGNQPSTGSNKRLNLKECVNSDQSTLDTVNCENIQLLKQEYESSDEDDSSTQCNSSLDMSKDSDSVTRVLKFNNVKQNGGTEDKRAGCDDKEDSVKEDISNPVSMDISNPVSTDISNPVSMDISNPVSTDISNPVATDISNPVSADISNPVGTDISNPVSTDISSPVDTEREYFIVKRESAEETPVTCLICGDTLKNTNHCLVHTLRAHANSGIASFPCSLCDMCFSAHTDFTRHFMNVHQNIKSARLLHVCSICGRCCASQRALENHVCVPVSSLTDQLACKICGSSFSTKTRLSFHAQFHSSDKCNSTKPYECVPCGVVFPEEDNLYDHIRFSHRGYVYVCNECGKYFNSRTALQAHTRSHQNLRNYKCDVCGKSFLDKQTLKEHSVSHMVVKPYQCHICGKYLNRNSRLKKHLMSHELQKTTQPQECFQCTTCGEAFPNEPNAIAHAEVGHAGGPKGVDCMFHLCSINKVYRCEFCERCYAEPASLNTHRLIHKDEPLPFKCHICGTGFSTFARVATHKVTHSSSSKEDEFSIPKLFLCDECDKSYVHWTYLSVHRKMIHAEVKHMYKCKKCPEQFINSWSLAYHRKTRHCEIGPPLSDGDLPVNERKPWKCEYCEKRYVSQHSLLIHIDMLHTGNNPGPSFQCDECGKRFARKLSLESHKKMHTGTKPFICPLCNKSFVHSSGLSSHLRLHKGDKPHSCEYCGKTFLQRSDRDDHVRKHTGEKPFTCQHCPKAFRTRAMWFEHTRIHRDERPFPCDICGAAFRRSYALKNHKTIHTGERPHICDVCGKAFRQKQDMQKHVKSHHQYEIQDDDIDHEVIEVVQSLLKHEVTEVVQ